MAEKTKFALYLEPQLKQDLEQHYRLDGSRSQTEFAQRALKFYLDYLITANAGSFLPLAIRSSIDGQLGTFQQQMAKLLFKLAVEQNTMMRLFADRMELTQEEVRQLRSDSVQDVKRTNGTLSFEKIARESEDGWQD